MPDKLHRFKPCTDVENHPALLAWQRIGRRSGKRVSIETLVAKPKSAIFRLQGLFSDGRSVIAKRKVDNSFDCELTLYREYFPKFSIPTIELLGWLQMEDGHKWLFLEDAGEVWYDPKKPDHRALAVDWMAKLHTQQITDIFSLPHTGLAYFRSVLASGRTQLAQGLTNPSLDLPNAAVINAILDAYDIIEKRWSHLEYVCAGLPCGLVHGDFLPKNVRVLIRDGSAELITFDWETAGMAFPAADVAMLPGAEPERRRYLSLVRNTWPDVTWDKIDLMYRIGQFFRLLHATEWASRSLAYAWIDRALIYLQLYEARLRERLRNDDWFQC
jgi:hypothetical protein